MKFSGVKLMGKGRLDIHVIETFSMYDMYRFLQRDTSNGRCLPDEQLVPAKVTPPPFVWKNMYTYIIIGISLLLMLLVAAAITSCIHKTDNGSVIFYIKLL